MDRYKIAGHRAAQLVELYETQVRRATLVDVQAGRDPRTEAFLADRGVTCEEVPSADFISCAPSGDRLIEAKGRGGFGRITVVERQLDTMRSAGSLAWLYVAFGVTQPHPASLYMVRDPGSLPWEMTEEATKPKGQARGVRHMAKFDLELDHTDPRVERADLSGLDLPPWAGAQRD